MDYPQKLETLENHERDSWNEDIEEFLRKPQSPSENPNSIEFDGVSVQLSIEKVACELQKELECSFKTFKTDEHDMQLLSSVRTGKNLLRWYIQIYLEQRQVQKQRHKCQELCKVDVLRSTDIISIMVDVLKQAAEGNSNGELASEASLFIFYATYSHFPGDETASKGIDHLIGKREFPQTCLEILMTIDSIPLALSIVRNLHSLAVSFPGAQASILRARIRCDPSMATGSAPWAPVDPITMDFGRSCLVLVRWSLDACSSFPCGDHHDKHAELVVEIFNCFYALRKGKELTALSNRNSNDGDENSLSNLVIRILQLRDDKTSDEVMSKRTRQCKLSAVSLLMDSDASFGKVLIENGSLAILLEIFKNQIQDTVDNKRLDSTATANLLPILVVFNRYCMANSDVKQQVKDFIFPKEIEDKIQKYIKESKKTKMSPFDAPKDTLRGKFIDLLSWVDGYVKRCAAELMWTLCDSDYAQFTCRVGLGNALPLLNSKGLSPFPIPS